MDEEQNVIAEVSHELRLPLANIKLLVDTLLDGAMDDAEAANRMLLRAQKEIGRLEDLVNNLLSVTPGRQFEAIEKQSVRLADACEYAIISTKELAKQKKITVSTDIKDDFVIQANPDQLNQVILNLVENAIKYTNDGGFVKIASGTADGSFWVEDTGIGIAQSEIPKIFKRFYRVNRNKAKGSTGLGLSIVKHILDLHAAKITVKSTVQEGSTFTVEFPS
jgi:two-component system phosphate regulon sensor histidine kinase PhoR